MNTTPVFLANRNSIAKVVINQGGTSSSKTFSIVQLLFLKAIEKPKQVITVTGESLPNLRKGSYRDAEHIYGTTDFVKANVVSWNNRSCNRFQKRINNRVYLKLRRAKCKER